MFSYCEDNPVKYVDSEGEFICTITGAIAGAITGGISAWLDCDPNDPKKLEKIFATAALGAATGALAGACADIAIATGGVAGVAIAAIGGAAAGAINYMGTQGINDRKIDGGEVIVSAVSGGATNVLTMGMGAGPGTKAAEKTAKAIGEQVYKNTVNAVYGRKANAVLSGASILTSNMLKRAAKNLVKETINSVVIAGFGALYAKAGERGYNKIRRGLK